MINIISKQLEFEEELKRKIEFICDFCNTKPKIINGNIRNIEHTNLSYIEPHRVIIKGITFLVFNYSKILYINNLLNSIEIKDLEDIQEIVPDFYIANATIHFDEHSPHMHIVGVPVKENCKTSLSRQVGKTSIFTKESLVVIHDKMRERCIDEFNVAYGLNSKLKEKEKGKNRDITSYERKLFNERVKGLKQEISNLENEVSDLEDNKKSINKQITKLTKDKNDITDEIDKKKKLNNKIVLKSKNKMQDEINKLTEENIHLKFENKQYKEKYEELEEKTNYLINHLNKVFEKLPEFIQKIVEKLFNNKVLSLFSFKHDYDPEDRKANQEFIKKHNLFNKREIEKATKHLTDEMDEVAEEFYKTKKDKEKDDGLSL